MDTSQLLNGEGKRNKHQMLIGMLMWVVTISRIHVAHATSFLSRFARFPSQGHLEGLLQVFGYLKIRSNKRIVVDSAGDPMYRGGKNAFDMEYTEKLKDQ
jgi:hypothetical protein